MIQYSKMPFFIFIASVLIVFSASSRADIVECVDEAGSVLYTDLPCKSAADRARAVGGVVVSTVAESAVKLPLAEQEQAAAQSGKVAPARGLALDVVTMKAARDAMAVMDHAASLSRQQALMQN